MDMWLGNVSGGGSAAESYSRIRAGYRGLALTHGIAIYVP